jgi:hypothetical protein
MAGSEDGYCSDTSSERAAEAGAREKKPLVDLIGGSET